MVVRMINPTRFKVETIVSWKDNGKKNEFFHLWYWGRKWFGLHGWKLVAASESFAGPSYLFFSREEVDTRIKHINKYGPDARERYVEEVVL
jgi:hypothetical protein